LYSDEYDIFVVEKGHTAFSIAKQYGMTIEEFKKINNKKDFNIKIGEEVFVKKNFSTQTSGVKIDKKTHQPKGEARPTAEQKALVPISREQNLQNISNIALRPQSGLDLMPKKELEVVSDEGGDSFSGKKNKHKIEIINTFGKSTKYSDGIIISGKPGKEFYSPLQGKIIYKGFLGSIGGDVIILEFFRKSKKLRAIFFNIDINHVKINQNVSREEFLGYVKYENSMGVFVVVMDDNDILIPLNRVLD
jgi:murein DD-endopeptidase MepM/ murein hydrolase activator NlpD